MDCGWSIDLYSVFCVAFVTAYVSSVAGGLSQKQDWSDASIRGGRIYLENDDSHLRLDGSRLAHSWNSGLAHFVRNSVIARLIDFSSLGGLRVCRVAWGGRWFCFDVARRCRRKGVGDHLVVEQHRAATDRPIRRHRFSDRKFAGRVFGCGCFFIAQRRNADEVV